MTGAAPAIPERSQRGDAAFPARDPTDRRLLDGWQRDLPLVPRPFARIGLALGIGEAEVLVRLARFSALGALSRVGATVRPNTAGASTLAAVAVTEARVASVANLISCEPGVNHVYLRDDPWNIWFVVTGPDRDYVQEALERIGAATSLTVIDLRLVRPYHIDLGFSLDGTRRQACGPDRADPGAILDGDHAILDQLTRGLALTPRPYRALSQALGSSEARVIGRIRSLSEAGVISRLGLILRHRALGWTDNAMVVWNVPVGQVDRAGERLASQQGVTLCYQRRPDPVHWPFNLYCMIHARSRDAGMATLERATHAAGMNHLPNRILFSTRCFKQRGAMVLDQRGAVA